MIQVYSESNTDYTKNGDYVLTPTECTTTSELNGEWSASLIHPIDEDGRWEYLTDQAVVRMPSWNGSQLYRIVQREVTDTEVACTLYPIFYDAMNDVFLVDVRPTDKNGKQALDIMLSGNAKYSAESDIGTKATAYYEFKNFFEALNGEDNCFLERWGGEVEFDNFTIRVNNRIGADNGLEMRYGKNIEEINESVDMTEVVTRIYPKGYNGRTITGNGYVDSDYISAYPTVKIATLDFDDVVLADDLGTSDPEGKIICQDQAELDAALTSKCEEQYALGLDKPQVNITIHGLIDLSKAEEYKQFANEVELGDTVHLIHPKLGITTDARIISLTYDCIRQQVDEIEIGSISYNLFRSTYNAVNKIDGVIRSDGTVRAEAVSGQINGMKTKLYAQYDQASHSDVQAILFENNDEDSPHYGAMAIGTAGFMIADSKTGEGTWSWRTLGTAKGIVADAIYTGVISSQDGKSYWDMIDSKFVSYEEGNESSVVMDNGHVALYAGDERIGRYTQGSRNVDGERVPLLALISPAAYGTMMAITDANEQPTSYVAVYQNSDGDDAAHFRAGDGYITITKDGTYTCLYISTDRARVGGTLAFTGTKTINGTTYTYKNGLLMA